MENKIYTVWGANHSGKTTFAVNLACALSKRDLLVGLISSNLIYGELQIFFGQSVAFEKGLYKALQDDAPNLGEKFTEYEEIKNLFFLSVPTHYSGLLCDTVTLQSAEQLINNASITFDVLIIDGSAEINNPISSVGLWLADKIFTLHKPSIAAQMWHQGVADFVRELHITDKQLHILQAPNGEFDDKTYKNMVKKSFDYELPYVNRAGELQNAGTPLYIHHDRHCRRYSRVLERIAGKICGGTKA
jgi:MinD-like ATPase involved in chromosome partitioning or flagellar assembly